MHHFSVMPPFGSNVIHHAECFDRANLYAAQQLAVTLDPVDLTGEESEPANKRPRTDDNTPKSSMAMLHEQNQQHSQRLVKVKQEKSDVETTLANVRGEKEAMEADLEEAKGDLEDSNELVEQQALTTNIWQGRFDELVSLVEAGGQVDGATIAEIRNRSLASGS